MMKKRLTSSIVGLIVAVLITPAWGFDIPRAITSGRMIETAAPNPALEFRLRAILSDFVPPSPALVDTVVTWLPPSPVISPGPDLPPDPVLPPFEIQVLIPAGCFERNFGFHVADFRRCDVQITIDSGSEEVLFSISDFEASIVQRRDNTFRFIVAASVTDSGLLPTALGVLGGSGIRIDIGTQAGIAVLNEIRALSGIQPQPF